MLSHPHLPLLHSSWQLASISGVQGMALSPLLLGCSVLRWSPCGFYLAVPGIDEVTILNTAGLSIAATIHPSQLCAAWLDRPRPLDVAWLPDSGPEVQPTVASLRAIITRTLCSLPKLPVAMLHAVCGISCGNCCRCSAA